MSRDAAILIERVSKTFRLAHDPVYSLKERLVHRRRRTYDAFQALKPLDLEIPQGQTVGILGHNGSGKSTLLKCIAGILSPTTGQIRLRGRLASLLELGAGFHPELTGRENVYINAAFLGISKRDIAMRFDDIVAFAELEQFIDEPVKHYSSGMHVRLGFAVAVNLDPDILLVDEVLTVGDEVFQAKCISRVKQFQREGRTIVVVTHAADTVRQVCERALVLHHGELVADGPPGQSIRTFREHLHGVLADASDVVKADGGGVLTTVEVRYPDSAHSYTLSGGAVELRVHYECDEPIDDAVLTITVSDRQLRPIFVTDTDRLGTPLPRLSGGGVIDIAMPHVHLLDGTYPVSLKLSDRAEARVVAWRDGRDSFAVMNTSRADGLIDLGARVHAAGAVVAQSPSTA